MKVIFEGNITGAEILVMNPNLTDLENDVLYKYKQGEKIFGNKIECEIDRLNTEAEEAETLKQNQLSEIKTELSEAVAFENTEEITRCKQAYADLNDGITIQTKTEVETQRDEAEAQRDEAEADAEKFLGMFMDSEEVW